MTTEINDILKLPVDESFEIMEKIWESLDENIPVTEYKMNVAKERLEEYQKKSE